jgi:hypothetical protein
LSIYDATSSWSGYQYQGKVAIYKVIEIISMLIRQGREAEIADYELELENLEDFAIVRNHSYVSAHQVKAYTSSNTINEYIDAINKLYRNPNGVDYYLHVIRQVNNWSLAGLESTLNTRISHLNTKIGSLGADKQSEINKLIAERNVYQELLDDSSQVIAKVNLYNYGGNRRYCELNQIQNSIKENLTQYYNITNQEEQTGRYAIEICYINLVGKIDEYVRDRHLKIALFRIPFSELRQILDTNLSDRDEKYHIYVIKESYCHRHRDDYCLRCQSSSKKDCLNSSGRQCSLLGLMKDINDMNLTEFCQFIKKINPHVLATNIDDFCREEYLQRSGIQALFSTINSVKIQYELDNKKLIYKGGTEAYLPTTISADGEFVEADEEEYCRAICKNDSLLVELYESTVFITKNVNRVNIFDTFNDVEEIDDYQREEIIKNKKYDIFSKVISLKEKAVAVEELNNV